MPEVFQLQNCVEWNIKRRDGCLLMLAPIPGAVVLLDDPSKREYQRSARRHQRNIDALNVQIKQQEG